VMQLCDDFIRFHALQWDHSSRSLLNTGGRRHGGLDRQKFGLDIIKIRETTGTSDRGIMKVAVGRSVDFHDKGGKENMHAKTVHADEATTSLTLMSSKAVKRVAQVRTWRQSRMRIFLPLRDMTAVPWPRMGANKLLPIRTRQPETGW